MRKPPTLVLASFLAALLLVLGRGGFARAQAPTAPQTFTYSAGWHLAAFPSGTNLSAITGPLYTWQPGDTSYETVQPSQGAKNGLGYWAYFASPTTITLAAGSNTPTQLNLPAGQWAIAGDPSGAEFAMISGIDMAYTYDPTNGYVSVLGACGGAAPPPGVTPHCAFLSAGQGVWIYSAAGSTVSITPATAPPS